MKTITCVSFHHFQFLLSTNQHCVHQRWNLHLNHCCHSWPNTCRSISLILHNSRLCHLQCNSSQRKKLSQLTPHRLILPFNNWNIWMFTQTSWFVLTWVCQCYLEPKSAKGPSPFCFGYFSLSKNFSYIAKRCKHPPS
jgi:hypothetical protein